MTAEPGDLQEWEQDVVLELAQGTVPRWISAQHGVTEAQVRAVGEKFGWPRNTRQIKAAATRIRAQRAETAAGEPPAPGALEAGDGTGMEGQPQPAAETTDPEPAAEPVAEPVAEPTDAADAPEACKFDDQHRHWASGGRPAGSVATWADVVGRLVDCDCGGGVLVDPDIEQPPPSILADLQADLHRGRRAAALADDVALLGQLEQITHRPEPTDRATLRMPLGRLVDADGRETVLGMVEIDVQLHVPGVLEALAGKLFTGEEGGHLVIPTRIERRLTPDGEAAIRALAALLTQDGAS